MSGATSLKMGMFKMRPFSEIQQKKPMKYTATFLFVVCCGLISFDSMACPSYTPYIEGPDYSIHVNTGSTFPWHVISDDAYKSTGTYRLTEWSVVNASYSKVLATCCSSYTGLDFTGVPEGTYTLYAKDAFGSYPGFTPCYGCLSNTTFSKEIVVFSYPFAPSQFFAPSPVWNNYRDFICTGILYADQYEWVVYYDDPFDAYNWVEDEYVTRISNEPITTLPFTPCQRSWSRVRARAHTGQVGPWSEWVQYGTGCGGRKRAVDVPPVGETGSATEEASFVESQGDVVASPNPSDHSFNVTLPMEIDRDVVSVVMRSVSGSQVEPPYSVKGRKLAVDASNATPGLYLLTISDGKTLFNLKVIRE